MRVASWNLATLIDEFGNHPLSRSLPVCGTLPPEMWFTVTWFGSIVYILLQFLLVSQLVVRSRLHRQSVTSYIGIGETPAIDFERGLNAGHPSRRWWRRFQTQCTSLNALYFAEDNDNNVNDDDDDNDGTRGSDKGGRCGTPLVVTAAGASERS